MLLKINKTLALTFLMTIVICGCKDIIEDEPAPDDPVNIPDNSFFHSLISRGVDTNGDSLISYAEAKAVRYLNISRSCGRYEYTCDPLVRIGSLEGIEAFTNLDTLSCNSHLLTKIDVSGIPGLKYLDCAANNLTTLDVSKNTALTYLECAANELTTLDISKNNALTLLDCSENPLTSLDITNNTALTSLYCVDNQLTSLDVTNNIALTQLYCKMNQLTSLDISNNNSLQYINLMLMPSLKQVCVWTMPFPPDSLMVDKRDSPNIFFTTECNK